jgi:hypothetical protein
MAIQVINVGTTPNDGTGDGLRTAYIKCNDNFAFLNSRVSDNPPLTSVGSVGDAAGTIAYDSGFLYVCYQDYDGSSLIWGRVALTSF